MKNLKEVCLRCGIPRSCYDLKNEPSFGNPDYSIPKSCQEGHYWSGSIISIKKEGGK